MSIKLDQSSRREIRGLLKTSVRKFKACHFERSEKSLKRLFASDLCRDFSSLAPRNDTVWVIVELRLKNITAAWLNGRLEELAAYFHDEMVIVPPGFQGRSEGKQACLASYEAFIGQAAIREYNETEPDIDIWGDTAVAVYRFAMTYEMAGETYRDAGHDVFAFTREEGAWRAVWRTIVPFIEEE